MRDSVNKTAELTSIILGIFPYNLEQSMIVVI